MYVYLIKNTVLFLLLLFMLLNCGAGKGSWTARRSNQVNLKGNQSWVFIGRTDAEADTPVLWPPHAKS